VLCLERAEFGVDIEQFADEAFQGWRKIEDQFRVLKPIQRSVIGASRCQPFVQVGIDYLQLIEKGSIETRKPIVRVQVVKAKVEAQGKGIRLVDGVHLCHRGYSIHSCSLRTCIFVAKVLAVS
jgi:hypothetical protein